MNTKENRFENVSLLITHFNRSSSLERLLRTFKDQEIYFNQIIVSDDASSELHLNRLKELEEQFDFMLVTTPVNGGLGNNLNKGQMAVKTPYTLYVQEDFIPTSIFLPHFMDALQLMNEEPEIDIARFYAYFRHPYLQSYKKGFSKMLYKPWFMDKNKIYNYSDHPHLRRSTFFDRFGKYTEGIKSDKTEYEMCVSFIQNHGKALFYDDFNSLFIQENSAAEPSTVQRSNWKQSGNPLVAGVRAVYRFFKYNYDLHIDTKFKR
ncbi:glycosyltransferase [Pedobacter metabolipauper]|uniref:Glycosyl transferase family 2 n=1 Tax=Pedobacter metabolipauper TaxID=425513 RepID=A0A4R6T0T9_9SPHI|nr:glycosyltransferase [Pedobacter metabolipauper]TDQ11997.1 glycosyl transferase family 2 [Pedobacter metabolipauper]